MRPARVSQHREAAAPRHDHVSEFAGDVVVGVEGSAAAQRALHWAAQHAAGTGTRVRAVACWDLPSEFGHLSGIEAELESQAREWLDAATTQILATFRGVEITTHVVQGDPTTRLLDLSADASLLVLGNHPRSGLAAAFRGSVVRQVIRRSHCPVVVVP